MIERNTLFSVYISYNNNVIFSKTTTDEFVSLRRLPALLDRRSILQQFIASHGRQHQPVYNDRFGQWKTSMQFFTGNS